ncbi:MAG: penicillin-binding transpeptidase domain-containing protein [Ignavibacteria bacterium]
MDFYSFVNKERKRINVTRRMNVVMFILLAFLALVITKLVSIQILESEKYKLIAKKQSQSREIITPSRGIIFDRSMNPLVSNVFRVSVIADPYRIKNPDSVSALLANVFSKNKSEYYDKLVDRNNSAFYLERKVSVSDLKGLDTLRIEGLNVFKEAARYYNYGSTGSQIIGFTDLDNRGVSGIELSSNKELTGKEGYMISRKDGRGVKRPDMNYIQKEPETGANVILTIDKNIQEIAEQELASGMKYFNASHGKAVVVNVKTGEILAMCTFPTFDPNNIRKEDTVGMKNAVLSDIYEPGSTFKIVTASAILEEKIDAPNNVVNTENGTYTIYGMDIIDSYGAPSLTFQQVIEKSSNIGVAKLSQKLGAERFFKYARDYGFGIYTGIELNGENKGYLKRPIDFTPGSLEFMSIGYQIAVNVLQITMAYASIANNGLLMKPFIVKKELSPDGSVLYEGMPSPVRQVISEETAKKLNQMFIGVVERGTGTDAKIDGVSVAGKTGTTQRIVEGEYSSSSHISSFVGYFPAENPEIIISVVIDDPKNGYYGGKVAAPVFKKIAERIIEYNGNTGSLSSEYMYVRSEIKEPGDVQTDGTQSIPNLKDMRLQDALEILQEKNIPYELDENAGLKNDKGAIVSVVNQEPSPGTKISNGSKVKLYLKNSKYDGEGYKIVPDVRRMSLRKSINKLVSDGFTVDINGSGEVVDIFPKPGTRINPKSKIILFCKNENK